MTTSPSDLPRPNYFKAFAAFFVVAALISIPAANAQIEKQNMAATPADRLLLYAVFGVILGAVATFFYWWHRGSKRGLFTALAIIAVFAFFGWRGAAQ
jgi:prolipoprotein diacylglyceryltransferase